MDTRNYRGYRRIEATKVGSGAAEVVWSIAQQLRNNQVSSINGQLVSVFDHTIHVTLPPLGAEKQPSLIVFGTADTRDGPVLIQLDSTDTFDSYDPTTGSDVWFRLRANTSSVSVHLGGGITAVIPLSVVPILPAAGGLYQRFEPQHFHPDGAMVGRHRHLVHQLQHDEINDGLGLLDDLYRWNQDQYVEPFFGLINAFATILTTNTKCVPTAIKKLVGRGPGGTPSGDDFLIGVLLVLRMIAHDTIRSQASYLADEVASHAAGNTTRVSAALLRQAARRRAARPTRQCVKTLLRPVSDQQAVHQAARQLTETGHTSGVDCLTGILTATTAVLPVVLGGSPR